MRWVWHVARMKDDKCAQNLGGMPEGKRPF